MKKLHKIPLTAINEDGTTATPQTVEEISRYTGESETHTVDIVTCLDGTLNLFARGALYMSLTKHPTQNYWHGVSSKGNKVQVSLKTLVGEIRIWKEEE